MKYFHRTTITLGEAIAAAAAFFGARMTPTEEGPRRRRFSSTLGEVIVSVQASDGGHYAMVVVETNQPGESELDRIAKRFLSTIHAAAHSSHVVRGAY